MGSVATSTSDPYLTDGTFEPRWRLVLRTRRLPSAYGHISDWNTSAVTDMSEAFTTGLSSMRISAVGIHLESIYVPNVP